MRKRDLRSGLLVLFLILTLLLTASGSSGSRVGAYNFESSQEQIGEDPNNLVRPIIHHPDVIDRDFDGVQDSLEAIVSQVIMQDEKELLPVIVTLYNPVSHRDLNYFKMLQGRVTRTYQYVTYGFAGVIPAANIPMFASLENGNLCLIERDVAVRCHLDVSVPLIRARPMVWDTHGYTGSPNYSIAIIDTGIDDSHPDVGPYGDLNFSRKMVGWYDATDDYSTAPEDYHGHGTHCAGIAAGTGEANLLQGSGFATTTWAYTLEGVPSGFGYLHYGFDVMNPGLITLNCTWTSSNLVVLQLRDVSGQVILKETSGRAKPLVLTYYATESGRYRPFIGIGGLPFEIGVGYFSLGETYPYQGRNDGYNLFTGVAPTSKLVGVKVFNNTGQSPDNLSWVLAGMDWVIANKYTYNITVVSMSLGLEYGDTSSTFDQKADTMVENGIVMCVSAGNDFPGYTIGSPGTAAYVITVGATNDQNGVTFYSSNGDPSKNEYGLVKPDVVAPGGSTGVGNLIVSADSNDVDCEYSGQSDFTPNDYQQMMGTSMATPHVAGLTALIIDAMSGWSWTKEEALKVKMIVSMTAFEVQSGEDSNVPPLNRGGKDNVEGYGRICPDAAIEAVTMSYSVGELGGDTFGSGPSDKKVWARQVALSAGTPYELRLAVPSGADYDLYLYDENPDSCGQPVILAKSVNTTSGVDEAVQYTPTTSSTNFVVVKWVSGSGAFDLTSTHEQHDVAVVSVAPSANEAYAGKVVNVTVVVKNEGTTKETFNVTAFSNETAIGTKNVTNLAPEANTTLIFAWNTSDVSPGYYTISATAQSVLYEMDLIDNSLTDDTVHVKIPGDVNGDTVVDILDAGEISAHWYPGPPVGPFGYGLDADINDDGVVDIFDAAIMSANWLRREEI